MLCCCRKQKRKKLSGHLDNNNQDLTKGEPLLISDTIEELKSKLETQEIVNEKDPDSPDSPTTEMIPEAIRNTGHNPTPLLTNDGLILPRKPANPVRENPERQNLHKELLFNQKIGKNVLNQKSELQRALERQKDNLARKQLDNHIAAKTPELERVIADRAKRLQSPDTDKSEDKVINQELLKIRMQLRTRQDNN